GPVPLLRLALPPTRFPYTTLFRSEVDPQQRDPGTPRHLCAAQDAAVTTQHHHELGVCCQGGDLGVVLQAVPPLLELVDLDVVMTELGGDLRGQRRQVGTVGVGHQQDPAGHLLSSGSGGWHSSRTRAAVSSALIMPGAEGANQSRYSRLPCVPSTGEGSIPCRWRPSAVADPTTSVSTRACSAGEVTTPSRPSLSRPTSNCGFTRNTTSAPSASSGSTGGRTRVSE